MKKIFTFLTAALFAASLWGSDITIGGSGSNDTNVPFSLSTANSATQSIFTCSELTTAGLPLGAKISKIAFKYTSGTAYTRKLKVYITNRASDVATSYLSSYKFDKVTSSDLFCDTTITLPSTSTTFYTLNLSKEFVWDGSSNICVIVCDNTNETGANFKSHKASSVSTTPGRCIYTSNSVNPTSSSTNMGSKNDYRPVIQLTYSAGGGASLEVSPSSVDFGFFDKTTETKSAEITITGENLTDGVTIAAEQGLSVEPTTLTKEAVMAVGGAKITVSSTAEFVSGRKITISSTGATSQTVTCSGTQGITIDDAADNTSVLAANDGQSVNIAFKRSFVADMFNTICLPISLNEAFMMSTFGSGYSLIELTSTTKDGDDIVLNFSTKTELVAGKPYFIKPTQNVVNPSFTNWLISKDLAPIETTYADFIPVFSPTALASSKDILFLGVNNELFWPSDAGTLKGLRCYFQMKNGASAGAPVRMSIGRGTPTSNETLEDNAPAAIKRIENGQLIIERNGVRYNINGQIIK